MDGLRRGGKERRMVELVKYLKNNSAIDLELLLMSNKIEYSEVHELKIPIHFLIRKSRKDVKIFYHLFNLCNRLKPDIIHAWDSMTAIYAAPIAKVLGIKLINGMITDSFFKNNIFRKGWIRSKTAFLLSDVVVANSQAGLMAYKAPQGKSVCIYNGFDPIRTQNLIGAENIRKKFNIETPKVVGMVASFTELKDYHSFLASAQQILQQRNDVTFLAIGAGETLEKCKSMIDEQHKGKIKFLGMQSNVESIMNIMNIGVLATNVERHEEGISNSILEYMALGKPVIATDSGGTKEVIVDGETGFIISPKNVNELTSRIVDILNNPEQGMQMGRRGKERIFENFTLESMANKYLKVYQDCVINN